MRIEPSNSSGVLTVTATSVVCNSNCIVQAIVLNPGSTTSTVTLVDPSGQGVTVSTNGSTVVQLSGAANTSSVVLPISGSGIEFKNGCIAVVAGTGASASVIFAKTSG